MGCKPSVLSTKPRLIMIITIITIMPIITFKCGTSATVKNLAMVAAIIIVLIRYNIQDNNIGRSN